MPYPLYRPRRLRESPLLRKMVRETALRVDDFMLPLFTVHGRGVREPIGSMPGQYRLSIDELLKECGVVEDGRIKNDPTLDLIARTALSHVEAGADMVAPSDMMDGHVAAVREALDEGGYPETPIMAYSAKYASAFYGPFREAADSTPQFGDRRSYQMDPANALEAMREVALDVDEGADIVMVKPALPYLDVVARVKADFGLPVAAYSVSGEYAMIRAAGQLGWLDEERAMLEALTGIRRAGADIIITYFAKDAARLLEQGRA